MPNWEEISESLKKYLGQSVYRFELNDYSAPSCTSNTKWYFGTPMEFEDVLNGMNEDSGYADELRTTYLRFIAGDLNIEHNAGFIKTKFAVPCSVIKGKEWAAETLEFRFENSYGFYYDIKAREVKFAVKAVVTPDGKVAVVYKAVIKDAKFKNANEEERWMSLGDQIWGHPGIIKVASQENTIELSNTLAVLDSVYDGSADAEKYIEEMTQPNMQAFFEDVFGDG